MRKNDTCVIEIVMFYETKTKNLAKLYSVLSYVLYYVIENYVCIDYLCCHSKKLSVISSDKMFEEDSYNEFIGIGIPEVIMHLIYCHRFTKNTNSTVILVYQYCLVN